MSHNFKFNRCGPHVEKKSIQIYTNLQNDWAWSMKIFPWKRVLFLTRNEWGNCMVVSPSVLISLPLWKVSPGHVQILHTQKWRTVFILLLLSDSLCILRTEHGVLFVISCATFCETLATKQEQTCREGFVYNNKNFLKFFVFSFTVKVKFPQL